MRWPLILSTFITALSTLSFVCVSLIVPLSWVEIERRAGAKDTSKNYRENAKGHEYAYTFGGPSGVTREKLKPDEISANGEEMLKIPGVHADHVYEHQMLKAHQIRVHLHPDLKKEVKEIINGPENMAPVPGPINMGKGQVIKHGMAGKALKPNPARDQYTLLSYGTAKKTAQKLDEAFKNHGYDFKDKTFHNMLRTAMDNTKIVDPKSSSAGGSNTGSANANPRRTKPFVVGKQGTPLKSPARLATKKPKGTGKKK
ncbi:hypothetical protein BYT27DRAFT_7119876 [Phlegmacium glaucopus]|nr:hypothetical protein BYT27DRAFT_7119876 [Phlegmacium glaucopus]